MALLDKPIFTLMIFAVLLIACNLQLYAPAHASALTLAGASHLAHARGSMPVLVLAPLLRLGAVICLTIHVMRFSVFGNDASRFSWFLDGTFWRYWRLNVKLMFIYIIVALLLFACIAICMVIMKLAGIALRPTAIKLFVAGALCVGIYAFIMIRLSLLFCHTAVGGRPRIKDSWNDTRGQVWSIVGAHFLTILPFVPVALLFFAVRKHVAGSDVTAADQSFSIALMQAVCWLVLSSTGAACSAWIYRRYAADILDT